ncbi:MAG: class B sortase [Bacteroides sp.]|nr:class B sortase [Bacteroides sp.]MCM1549914.1 class B sortase [Clostridium sp.]
MEEKKHNILKEKILFLIFAVLFLFAILMIAYGYWQRWHEEQQLKKQQEAIIAGIENPEETESTEDSVSSDEQEDKIPVILSEYQGLYEQNQDMIGWLQIDGTNIDYPVMQTLEDEEYYLYRDFYGEDNQNGCLIMDTDSNVGVGSQEHKYQNGSCPSTNLMIHGHTMKSGEMFGNLDLYAEEAYGLEHNIICFDSLYEHREYELIAVFYSQVFYENEDVFKYYKFFQADTQEEFDNWYNNIKQKSVYDTGEFGDEFITLSCCAYHVEDGRFVVVAKRIRH